MSNTLTTDERINLVASGKTVVGVEIYWDKQDPHNIGPAYRDGQESGSLEFHGWAGNTDGSEDDTYSLANYFSHNCEYAGPDQHGVYPTFAT